MIATRFIFLPGVGGKNHGPIVHGKNGATHTISRFVSVMSQIRLSKDTRHFRQGHWRNGEFPLNMLNYIHSGRLNAKMNQFLSSRSVEAFANEH